MSHRNKGERVSDTRMGDASNSGRRLLATRMSPNTSEDAAERRRSSARCCSFSAEVITIIM